MTRRSLFLISLVCIGTFCASHTRAGYILNVQPYVICDSNCTNCNNVPANFEAAANKVWAQADVTLNFLPPQMICNSNFQNVVPGGSGPSSTSTLFASEAASANTLNLFFVNTINGGNYAGLASGIPGNSAAIASNARLDTVAHEIGHDLGLTHFQNNNNGGPPQPPNNLMAPGGSRQVPNSLNNIAPDGQNRDQLTQQQITLTDLRSILIPTPLFTVSASAGSLRILQGDTGTITLTVTNVDRFPIKITSIETPPLVQPGGGDGGDYVQSVNRIGGSLMVGSTLAPGASGTIIDQVVTNDNRDPDPNDDIGSWFVRQNFVAQITNIGGVPQNVPFQTWGAEGTVRVDVLDTPEPTSSVLLLTGLPVLAWWRRKTAA